MVNTRDLRVIAVLISLLFTAFFVLIILFRGEIDTAATATIESYGLVAIFLGVFLLELLPQYISPHLLVISAIILGFHIVPIILVSILGHIFASLLGFHLGKVYGFRLVEKLYSDKTVSKISSGMDRYGRWIVLLSAFLPFPYIPVIFGSLDLTWKNFWIFGIIPRAISFALLGFGLSFLTF
ncbi:MAG: VTT domain-containing protein [Candidatus Methanoperedens sp.]